ncbi:unnamed protein product [Ascophyllum nodosum]
MKAVEGELADSFANLMHCADIIQRYPGICRIRPHLTHCILAVSAIAYRPVYDQVRAVYNAIQLPGYKPTPPYEEWTGMSDICDGIFCRSVQTETKDSKLKWNSGSLTSETSSSISYTKTDLSPAGPAALSGVDSELSPQKRSPSSALVSAADGEARMRAMAGPGMKATVEAPATAIMSAAVEEATTPLPSVFYPPASPTISATFSTRISPPDASPDAHLTNKLASATAAGNDVVAGVAVMMRGFSGGKSGISVESDCGAASAAPAPVRASASSIPDVALFDAIGVEDGGNNLRLTREDFMDAAEVLLGEGLLEGKTVND